MSEIFDAIASLPGTQAAGQTLMVRCPFHYGERGDPNMRVYQDHAYCLVEQRSYSIDQTYTALLLNPTPIHSEDLKYPDRLVPVHAGSWAEVELSRRRITDYTRLRMSVDGRVIAFMNEEGIPEVYRFHGIGYRTVGKSPIWSQQPKRGKYSGTLVVYGMLDAVVCAAAAKALGLYVVTPTKGKTKNPIPYRDLPGDVWVWPDQGEENEAIGLLRSLGLKAGGLIHPVDGYKDPSDVTASFGLDWVSTYLGSYLAEVWYATTLPATAVSSLDVAAGI